MGGRTEGVAGQRIETIALIALLRGDDGVSSAYEFADDLSGDEIRGACKKLRELADLAEGRVGVGRASDRA